MPRPHPSQLSTEIENSCFAYACCRIYYVVSRALLFFPQLYDCVAGVYEYMLYYHIHIFPTRNVNELSEVLGTRASRNRNDIMALKLPIASWCVVLDSFQLGQCLVGYQYAFEISNLLFGIRIFKLILSRGHLTL